MVTGRSSRMWLGFGQRCQTSVNGRHLAEFALHRVAIARCPTHFGRLQSVFRSVGDFKIAHCRSPLLRNLSRRFAESVLLLTELAASNLPPSKMRRISTLARKPNFVRHVRDARIKRGLSVAEVADEVWCQHVEHILLGDGSGSSTGCQLIRAMQGAEVADQGGTGNGGWVSNSRIVACGTGRVTE
jgi:hypothetical protein